MTEIKTPHISKVLSGYAELMAEKDKQLGDNWKDKEDNVCPKCAGTGNNPQDDENPFCIGCDGTGIHFTLHYGYEDGVAFAFVKENGLDFVKEYCKAQRLAHAERQLAGKVGNEMGVMPFAMTKFIEMELSARGYEPKDYRNAGNLREMANVVAQEWPDFLTCNYTRF